MQDRVPAARRAAPRRAEVRLRLVGEQAFFGPGTARLLSGVRQCGSVYRACEKLGLSYSKGRRMLRELEESLGEPAVLCTKGGPGGGSARLTEAGQRLLERYLCLEQTVRQYADKQFAHYFPPEGD